MSNISFRIKQDIAELWKQKVIITSAAVATMKFQFGMCDRTVNSDVGTGDLLLVRGILHVCGHAHVRSHLSPGMDCYLNWFLWIFSIQYFLD